MPTKKRVFDVTFCILASVVWVPVALLCAAAILLTDGRPIFYISTRRVFGSESCRIFKFRTMIVGADKIANRDTVPIGKVRFLNITPDSPLYTKVGRIIERYHLTEIPQFINVLRGDMTLVGNRPLPERVVTALSEAYPWAESRFQTPGGMTGPIQLIGRDRLSDETRLHLEIAYSETCLKSYSWRLDLEILMSTLLCTLGLRKPFTPTEMANLLARHGGRLLYAIDAPELTATASPIDASPSATPPRL
jgi:lipopolysaccharide/colanic/teichoic acid biosynthesis glycosyltransferase